RPAWRCLAWPRCCCVVVSFKFSCINRGAFAESPNAPFPLRRNPAHFHSNKHFQIAMIASTSVGIAYL
ncbi:MAG: hypothetical protein MJA84_06865, partial [Firmicutes bacterium]|nr:hypothetical protein [Bacillota bacterium]